MHYFMFKNYLIFVWAVRVTKLNMNQEKNQEAFDFSGRASKPGEETAGPPERGRPGPTTQHSDSKDWAGKLRIESQT